MLSSNSPGVFLSNDMPQSFITGGGYVLTLRLQNNRIPGEFPTGFYHEKMFSEIC